MSATNWSICPQCKATAEAERQAQIERAADFYGKIPADEFVRMTVEAKKEVELDYMLREDYRMGVGPDGKFVASYAAHCEQCGYEFNFRHEEQTEIRLDGN